MIKQAKEFLKSQLGTQAAAAGTTAGAASGDAPTPSPTLPENLRISDEDYFAKSAEFSNWLLQERQLYFGGEARHRASHAHDGGGRDGGHLTCPSPCDTADLITSCPRFKTSM